MSITLYRGDFEKIEEFRVNRTDKYAAVGQGIYLTNNKDVANSYRVKGSDFGAEDRHIWSGTATDRQHAYGLAFHDYVAIQIGLDYKYQTPSSKAAALKQAARFIDQYKLDISDGIVKAHYLNQCYKELFVTYERPITKGYLSGFNFKRDEFNSAMFVIDGVIKDEFFWELIWDNNIDFHNRMSSTDKTQFIETNSKVSYAPKVFSSFTKALSATPLRKVYPKIAKVLEPYGYKGFEYHGGNRTGATIKHRAFAIWDGSWVNEHRIY